MNDCGILYSVRYLAMISFPTLLYVALLYAKLSISPKIVNNLVSNDGKNLNIKIPIKIGMT